MSKLRKSRKRAQFDYVDAAKLYYSNSDALGENKSAVNKNIDILYKKYP